MVEVLWLGAFAYLFNSISVFSVFLFPFAIQHNLITTLCMLPVFALLSYGASVSIIKLTDLIYQEQVGQQLIPAERGRTEMDLPTLIRYSLSHKGYGKFVYLVAVFCCIFIVVAMSLASSNSAPRIVGDQYSWVYSIAIILCVSFMNNLPFWVLQYIHIATMVCRLAYCIMRLFVKIPIVDETRIDTNWLFVPCLVTAFFYQLSLPRILVKFDRRPEQHINMQIAVLIFAVIAHAALLCGLSADISTDHGEMWQVVFVSLYTVSKVSAPQIYWYAMSRILIAWRYEIDLERAESEHWLFVRLIQTFSHFPVYIVSLILIYYDYDLFQQSFGYFLLMPLVGAVAYCALGSSHLFYLNELNQEAISKRTSWVRLFQIFSALLFILGVLNALLIFTDAAEGGVLAISTVGGVFLVMIAWKLGIYLME